MIQSNTLKNNKQFIAFILVGLLNTLFGYGLYFTFLSIGMHFSVAALLSTIIGVLFNFKTTGALVFKSKNNHLAFKFLIVYSLIYFLNIAGIYALSKLQITHQLSGAIMLIPMAILAFILNKYYVFQYKEKN